MRPLQIPSGFHSIGNETVPNAAPQHYRRFNVPVWVDQYPASWAHYEVFVAAGGYSRDDLWPNGFDRQRTAPQCVSVDNRIKELLAIGDEFRRYLPKPLAESRFRPLTGVIFAEAIAIANFFHARLPFEAEWEVAMQGKTAEERSPAGGKEVRIDYACFPLSRIGSPILTGMLEEWTGDSFSARYYRADHALHGRLPGPQAKVSIRGSAFESTHQDISFRVGRDPWQPSVFCGFRLVWDQVPSIADTELNWR